MASVSGEPRRPLAGSPFATSAPVAASEALTAVEVGDRVCHDRFGLGTVVSVGFPDVLRVDFGTEGTQQFRLGDPSLTSL